MSLAWVSKVSAQVTLNINRIPCDVISFQGVAGTEYTIQTSTDLASTNWNNLGIVIATGSGFCSYTNFPTSTQLFYRGMSVSAGSTSNAAVEITLDAASPLSQTVAVTDLLGGTYLGLPVLVFDVIAQSANLHLGMIKVNLTGSGNGDLTAAYLYQGTNLVASTSVSSGTAMFTIPDGTPGANVPGFANVPYTVKVDVAGVATGTENVVASLSTNQVIYNPSDRSVAVYGSASGNNITVAGVGPVFALTSAPTIGKVVTTDQYGNATDTYTATFNLQITAVGVDLTLGLPNSSYPAFGSSSNSTNVVVYQNGALSPQTYVMVASYSQPSGTTLLPGGNFFSLTVNHTVTVPVTYSFTVRNPGANVYAVQMESINWILDGNDNVSNFMADQTSWRTPGI